MNVVLSIIIPTHNRASDLTENVTALLAQRAGRPIEIIVVDSASDPDQAAALEVVRSLEGVHLIRLDRPGVSIARNAGVARARGAWCGFLDDDVVPDRDWMEAALTRIASCGDRTGVIAGRVLPRWPSAPFRGSFKPNRLDRRSRILLSVIDDARCYATSDTPFGISANLLIRREALLQAGGFPEGMGRVGKSLASGEDPYVIDEVVRIGFGSLYDGSICVEHKIHAKQLTRGWMARRAWHEGMVSLRRCRPGRDRAAIAARCAASLPALAVLAAIGYSRSDYLVRLNHNLGFVCGVLAGCLRWRGTLAEPPPTVSIPEPGSSSLRSPAR